MGLERYVKPHNKVSRPVVESDLPRVFAEALVMGELCGIKHGLHKGAYAIAHSQVNDTDPLRFFVMADGRIIINPEIVAKEREERSVEGCLSFPDLKQNTIPRWHKITIKYQVADNDNLVEKTATYANLKSRIFQHEIDHMNAVYIFNV